MSHVILNTENITFHRCPHDPENPYVQISRELVRDKSISPECRWMIIYLLTNKEGWVVNIKQLINHLEEFKGKSTVYNLVNEAIEAGYMKKEDVTDSGGDRKIGKKTYRYYVSESPKFKEVSRSPRILDFENSDGSRSPNSRALEISDYKNKQSQEHTPIEISKEEGGKPPAPPPPSSFSFLYDDKERGIKVPTKIKLTPEEYGTLCKTHGEAMVTRILSAMHEISINKPQQFNKYKSHYITANTWIKKQKEWDAQKKSSNPEKVSKHHGLQNDPSPVDPKRVFSFKHSPPPNREPKK